MVKWYHGVFEPYYHIQLTLIIQNNIDERENGKLIIEAMMKSTTVREVFEEVFVIRKIL